MINGRHITLTRLSCAFPHPCLQTRHGTLPHWKGPAGCRRKGLQPQLSGHCPCHLPGRGGRQTLAVLAPPVQPRGGERAQRDGHGSSSWRCGRHWYRGLGPQPRGADAAEAAALARHHKEAGVQGCLSPHPSVLTLHTAVSKGQESQQIERILFPPWGQHSESGGCWGWVLAGEGTH